MNFWGSLKFILEYGSSSRLGYGYAYFSGFGDGSGSGDGYNKDLSLEENLRNAGVIV